MNDALRIYKTFKRTCIGWDSFARANKITDRKNLTYNEARQRCEHLNAGRTPAQIKRGTMYEFEKM